MHTAPLWTHPAPPKKIYIIGFCTFPAPQEWLFCPLPASTLQGLWPSLAYQTVKCHKNKITSQLHACLHVSLLSPINPLCSTTPLLPPPSFLLPFPLLLSYPLVAIAVAVAVLIALALLVALALLAAVACCYGHSAQVKKALQHLIYFMA